MWSTLPKFLARYGSRFVLSPTQRNQDDFPVSPLVVPITDADRLARIRLLVTTQPNAAAITTLYTVPAGVRGHLKAFSLEASVAAIGIVGIVSNYPAFADLRLINIPNGSAYYLQANPNLNIPVEPGDYFYCVCTVANGTVTASFCFELDNVGGQYAP